MAERTADLYPKLKGLAYALAQIATGCTNYDAQQRGFKDVFDLIMSDSDHPRQSAFTVSLVKEMPSEKQRQILLDGMAKEYAELEGWMAYVDRECAA